MKAVRVAPQIYHVYLDPDRDEFIRKRFERWGWHNIHELTECVNDYILKMWPDKRRWGQKMPFTPKSLIHAFAFVNGFRRRSAKIVEPMLSWASQDFLALDSPPEFGVLFEKALSGKDFFVPAAWGIKVMELLELHIIEVFFEHADPFRNSPRIFDRLHGLKLEGDMLQETCYVELERRFVRDLT